MKPLTLQTRIALSTALVVALGMVLCGGAITFVAYRNEVQELDGQLRAEVKHIFEEWARLGGPSTYLLRENPRELREWLPANGAQRMVEVRNENHQTLYRTAGFENAPPVQGYELDIRNLNISGQPWRVAEITKNGTTIRLAGDLAPVNELIRQITTAFLIALPVLLGFVVLSGRWIASKALNPVKQITASAEKVTAAHLDRRVPVPPAPDEIQRLAVVLNCTFEQLEKSFGQAMRFSADASHELKTPLTVLRASLEALIGSPTLDESDRPAVADLLEQANRLSGITSGLLLLARADAGKLKLDLQSLDFCRVIADCVDDARIVAEPHGIEIKLTLPGSASVRADETRLSQILSNLFDNAVKYNVTDGTVQISLSAKDGRWALDVANTGNGIAPEHLPHIFTRFFRSEHFAHISGHGLGLSLASELARAHEGTLELVKSDKEWTIFRLAIPVSRE